MCKMTGGCYVSDDAWLLCARLRVVAICVTTGGCYLCDDGWLLCA